MIIAIDFDGTVVDHQFPKVGPDVPYAASVIRKLVARGDKVILWTMRSAYYLDDAVHWYNTKDIPLFGINANPDQQTWTTSPKAYAQLYIDDAAFGAPLVKFPTLTRECIDWCAVERKLLSAST